MGRTNSNGEEEYPMKVYEVYELNQTTRDGVMIGILPERRKDHSRATADSVLNWGRVLLGEKAKNTNIFFVEICLHKTKTGNFFPFSAELENNIQN
jgi:hypothetical protein